MCLCASLSRRRRGPAGLRDPFRFCRNCGLYILRSGLSACARHGRYHYPRRALRAVETPDGRLSKRLICRFLVSPIYICESPRRALPICFGTADFLFAGRKFFLNFRIACFQFHCFSFIICRHSSITLIGKPSEHMILVNMLK